MYFITCFLWKDKQIQASRCFGYFKKESEARQALNENCCDMYEHLYNYAYIEYIGEGIHYIAEKKGFFIYDDVKKGFFESEEPEELKLIVNFAIG